MDKFLITRNIPQVCLEELTPYFNVVMPEKKFSMEELKHHLVDAKAVLDIGWDMKRELFEGEIPNLTVYGTSSVGFDHLDVSLLNSKNIAIINTPQNVMHATAQIAVGLIFDVMRRISYYDRSLRRSPRWSNPYFEVKNQSLLGKTIGIVGFGRIGRTVAAMMKACGMKVIYTNTRRVSEEIEQKYDAVYVSFEELLKRADVVSLHCPYRPASHHMMNKETFALMKPTAYFINTARGKLVDEAALIDALERGVIAGAGLDVYENEPTVSEGFLNLDNVVMTPHIGTLAYEVRIDMIHEAIHGMKEVLRGNMPENIVNPEVLEKGKQ